MARLNFRRGWNGWSQNLGLKLFSFLIAIIMFVYVSARQEGELEASYPLSLTLPEGTVLTPQAPTKISAKLRGPWSTFRRLRPRHPVPIDLSGVPVGTRIERAIDPAILAPPTGMRVYDWTPKKIVGRLEPLISKDIRIEIVAGSPPKPGLAIKELKTTPQRIQIVGPESVMTGLEYIATEPVNLNYDAGEFDLTVRLRAAPNLAKIKGDTNVQITGLIEEEVIQQNVDLPVADTKPSSEGSAAYQSRYLTTLKGPAIVLQTYLSSNPTWIIERNEYNRVVKISLQPAPPQSIALLSRPPSLYILRQKTR